MKQQLILSQRKKVRVLNSANEIKGTKLLYFLKVVISARYIVNKFQFYR